jgi:uncharacterized membrane protein YkvA (DUF1232 family)
MIEKTVKEAEACVETHRVQSRRALTERLKSSIRRFFKEFRVMRRALVHPRVPWYAKMVAGCAVAYVISPIQVIPNFIPIIGQMDDVLVVSLGIRFLRRCVPRSVLEECRSESPTRLSPAIPASAVTNTLPNPRS